MNIIPTRPRNTVIGFEGDLDNIGFACDDGWQGRADTFASNNNVGIGGGAAAFLHQGCPVTIRDYQVVVVTGGMILNVECSQL